MAANPQSRKWMLTINNPQDCGLDHSSMQTLLSLFCPDYFCLADEIATTGTFHTHIFIYSKSPSFAFKSKDIDTLREAYRAEQYMTRNRELTVTYLYGASGTGKTSGIYKKHPANEICRITDYNGRNGVRFDAYHGQDVLVFEECNSQIPIEAMLNYLDVYPLTLPARYTDRTACYTKVYITSNIPLNEQYIDVRHNRLETWRAFIRRIHHAFVYLSDGTVEKVKFK